MLEKFVVAMYDKSCSSNSVIDDRLDLFARKQMSYQAIPPTRASLVQHIERAAYQTVIPCSQALECQPEEVSPAEW